MTITECARAYQKEYNQRPEVVERRRAYLQAYYQRPEVKERERERSRRPEIKEQRRAYIQRPESRERKLEYERRPEVIARRRAHHKECSQRLRIEFLDMYGGKCACCGEPDKRFLTMDHVNNNGEAHRRKRGIRGIFRDALAKYAPDEYQILCWNCNCGRSANGGICPHKSPIGQIKRMDSTPP